MRRTSDCRALFAAWSGFFVVGAAAARTNTGRLASETATVLHPAPERHYIVQNTLLKTSGSIIPSSIRWINLQQLHNLGKMEGNWMNAVSLHSKI